MRKSKVKYIGLMLFVALACSAKDFGVHGATFNIREEGLIAMIKRKLGQIDLPAAQAKFKAQVAKQADEPTPVGIQKAKIMRQYRFDPSYILEHAVYLPDGKLLYPAGTKVNPLDHLDWQERLIFFDGRDKAQVAWVKAQNMLTEQDKLILVAGKPQVLSEELGVAIYFDQFGGLCEKFKIQAVPAIIERVGQELNITETVIKEEE